MTVCEPHGQPVSWWNPVHLLRFHPQPSRRSIVQAEIVNTRLAWASSPASADRSIVPPMGWSYHDARFNRTPTRSPPTDREVSGEGLHQRTCTRGLQAFFNDLLQNDPLSKVRAATSCLSLLCAFSSCYHRRISAIAIGPQRVRQT